ncbi:MAG TPA: glycosyltransferase [Acidimicrobiales bacterium]|nr:glycosyltransferase [Acidimicrobiales bacterium]
MTGGRPTGAATRLFDGRWLGFTGIGRVSEQLLVGLAELAPEDRWILWGRPGIERYAWPGTTIVEAGGSPLAWAGQRRRPPPADTYVFPHVVRPATSRPSVVVLHDTIPLRWAARAVERRFWRSYYRWSTRSATAVLVVSEATARRARQDLGVEPAGVLPMAIDGAAMTEIRRRRALEAPDPLHLLYVGRVRRHKNLEGAIAGFAASGLAAGGGRFTIAGVDQRGRDELRPVLGGSDGRISVLGPRSEAELADLYASAGVLIQPSFEEGFGLTVVEALTAGIPVCCSDLDPIRTEAGGQAATFDPGSPASIAGALDLAAARARAREVPNAPELSAPSDMAATLVAALP